MIRKLFPTAGPLALAAAALLLPCDTASAQLSSPGYGPRYGGGVYYGRLDYGPGWTYGPRYNTAPSYGYAPTLTNWGPLPTYHRNPAFDWTYRVYGPPMGDTVYGAG